MDFIWNILRSIGPEAISVIILTIVGLFGFNLKSKTKQLGDLIDELTTSLEDGKLSADELKRISTKASVLFGKK